MGPVLRHPSTWTCYGNGRIQAATLSSILEDARVAHGGEDVTFLGLEPERLRGQISAQLMAASVLVLVLMKGQPVCLHVSAVSHAFRGDTLMLRKTS